MVNSVDFDQIVIDKESLSKFLRSYEDGYGEGEITPRSVPREEFHLTLEEMPNEDYPDEPFIADRIEPDAAEILSWHPQGSIEIPICEIDEKVAEILSRYQGHLILPMLVEGGLISPEVASHLSNRSGDLTISLPELNEEIAEIFAQAMGRLIFLDFEEISENTVEILKKKKGRSICLPWQEAFDDNGDPIVNVPTICG
jgi:hypothetical protein